MRHHSFHLLLPATTLHLPRPGLGFAARHRLVEALEEGLARRLILACAPAGFGKTVLLADWAWRGAGRWRGCRRTWVTITRHDLAARSCGAGPGAAGNRAG
jgi:ATP/maltotriose-dependent transcriptional regulator MalT